MRTILAVVGLFLMTGGLFAQAPAVKLTFDVDKDTVIIGDVVTLQAQLEYDESVTVAGGGLSEIKNEYLEFLGSPERFKTDTMIAGRYRLTMTEEVDARVFLDSGRIVLSPVEYEILKNGKSYFFKSDSVSIFVKPIISSKDPARPIKEIIREPKRMEDYLPWFIGMVALLLAIVLYLYLRKHRPEEEEVEEEKEEIPPAQEAIGALEVLLRDRLWETHPKETQIQLSQILRRFLEREYKVPALERTTGEIDRALKRHLAPNQRALLIKLLVDSDMVKFAKMTMPPERQEQSIREAREWVKRNRKQ